MNKYFLNTEYATVSCNSVMIYEERDVELS